MADDSGSRSNNAFIGALLSGSRHETVPQEWDIYAPVLGGWKIEGKEWVKEGAPTVITIDVEFSRILQGRAIQDVWSWRRPDSTQIEAGTTLRLYDPVEKIWNVTWLDPVARKRVQLTARKVGNDIVQIGTDAHGKPRRWTFTDITPTSFVWRGEHSDDNGSTWKLNAEYFAHRVMR